MKTSYELSLTESEVVFLSDVVSEFIVQAKIIKDFDPRTTLSRKLTLESLLDDAKSIAEKLLEATD